MNNFLSPFAIRHKCGFMLNEVLHAFYNTNRTGRAFESEKFELKLMLAGHAIKFPGSQ